MVSSKIRWIHGRNMVIRTTKFSQLKGLCEMNILIFVKVLEEIIKKKRKKSILNSKINWMYSSVWLKIIRK